MTSDPIPLHIACCSPIRSQHIKNQTLTPHISHIILKTSTCFFNTNVDISTQNENSLEKPNPFGSPAWRLIHNYLLMIYCAIAPNPYDVTLERTPLLNLHNTNVICKTVTNITCYVTSPQRLRNEFPL